MSTYLFAAFALSIAIFQPHDDNDAPPTADNDAQPSPSPAPVLADGNTIHWLWKDGLRFQTQDGEVKGKFGGRIQADASAIAADSGLPSGTEGAAIRRSRLFVQVDWDDWGLKAEYDFAGGDADFKDVFLRRKDAIGTADLTIGHFKEPTSIGQLTSSKYITFMERSLKDGFDEGRNLGIALNDTWGDTSGTWAAGVFRANTNDAAVSTGEGNLSLTARGTWTPVYANGGETLVHVGASYSLRDNDMVSFSQRPELALSDPYVKTGALMSDEIHAGNVELAGVHGAFHGTFSYVMADVSGAAGVSDAEYSGYNLQCGYFITGESRPYDRSRGTWGRVKPNDNYSKAGGRGALEAAIRFSNVDLNDPGTGLPDPFGGGAGIGGEEDNITLALNWYLTPNIRWGINYIVGEVVYGATKEEFRALGTRLQVDW